MIMFSIQIYCDFSGYSDIARGIIKFMGYRFKLNFDHPYAACGMQDFWSRWHISLSSWFRDYVYIPLGGNRKGRIRTCFNLFTTFLISGLWHGAALNFVIWGAYHGALQVVEKAFGYTSFIGRIRSWWGRLGILAVTQIEVLIGWVFFRASNWKELVYVLQRLFSFSGEKNILKTEVDFLLLFLIFVVMELFLIFKADHFLLQRSRLYRMTEPVLVGLLFLASILFRGENNGFIYFQF
jgi:alginate O-acetyltransferase complex protein AlgI